MRPALLLLTLSACQASSPAEPPRVVISHEGSPDLVLTRTSTGCTWGASEVKLEGNRSWTSGGLDGAPHPTGRWYHVRDPRFPQLDGARFVDEPGPPRRLSLLDPAGVPLFRIKVDGDRATVAGPDGASRAAFERTADGVRALGPDGTPTGRVARGTTDPVLVALLIGHDIVPDANAILACEHLALSTPVKK